MEDKLETFMSRCRRAIYRGVSNMYAASSVIKKVNDSLASAPNNKIRENITMMIEEYYYPGYEELDEFIDDLEQNNYHDWD